MLTYNEWFEQNMGIGGTPADYATEYALYCHTELSRPPKDVVEAINQKYPYAKDVPLSEMSHGEITDIQRTAALHGYSLASGDKWISVSERLPEKGERVIIFGENLGISSIISHIGIRNNWQDPINNDIPYAKHITHWQPLPSPPKQQQHG